MFSSFRRGRRKTLPMTSEPVSLEVFLLEDIKFDPGRPIAVGGYGDLFKGHHRHKGTLALKRLGHRGAEASDPRAVERVSR
jgi:hypothetical protein